MSKTTIEETVEEFELLLSQIRLSGEFEGGMGENRLSDFLRTALTTQRDELVKETYDLLEDHYWDSLEGMKSIVMKHVKGALTIPQD